MYKTTIGMNDMHAHVCYRKNVNVHVCENVICYGIVLHTKTLV